MSSSQPPSFPAPILRAWAYRAGVNRELRRSTYDTANERLKSWLKQLVEASSTVMEYSFSTTVVFSDVAQALEHVPFGKDIFACSANYRETERFNLFNREYTQRELYDMASAGRLDLEKDFLDPGEAKAFVDGLLCEEGSVSDIDDDESDAGDICSDSEGEDGGDQLDVEGDQLDVESDQLDDQRASRNPHLADPTPDSPTAMRQPLGYISKENSPQSGNNSSPDVSGPKTTLSKPRKRSHALRKDHGQERVLSEDYVKARAAYLSYKSFVQSITRDGAGERTNGGDDDDEDAQEQDVALEKFTRDYDRDVTDPDWAEELYTGLVGDEGFTQEDHDERATELKASTDHGFLCPIFVFKSVLSHVALDAGCAASLFTRDAMCLLHFLLEKYAELYVFSGAMPQETSVLFGDLEAKVGDLTTEKQLLSAVVEAKDATIEELKRNVEEANARAATLESLNTQKDDVIAELKLKIAQIEQTRNDAQLSTVTPMPHGKRRRTYTGDGLDSDRRVSMASPNPATYTGGSVSSAWTQGSQETPVRSDNQIPASSSRLESRKRSRNPLMPLDEKREKKKLHFEGA